MLRVFARIGNVNIVATDEVKGTVTVSMHGVPWDTALDAILRAKSLGQIREGNLIRVAPARRSTRKWPTTSRTTSRWPSSRLVTRLVPLSYADGAKLMPRVQEVLSLGLQERGDIGRLRRDRPCGTGDWPSHQLFQTL